MSEASNRSSQQRKPSSKPKAKSSPKASSSKGIHRTKRPAKKPEPLTPAEVTLTMLNHGVSLAEEVEASALVVYAEPLKGIGWEPPKKLAARTIFVARSEEEQAELAAAGRLVVRVPRVLLTRMGQVRVAVFLALSQGTLSPGDRVVCLAGRPETPSLDMVLALHVGQEFESFLTPDEEHEASDIQPEVLARVVELAIDLGSEGREGKPVGTLFVVGDTKTVLPLTRQRILNPFHGYPEDKRNVLDSRLEDTIKELSTVDGAFVIRGDGVVHSSGTYLKTSALPQDSAPRGLGARHQAGAGITLATDCMAVAVSESTGTVTIFRKGQIVTEIEKPQKKRQDPSKN